jgi:hypothetical protein
LLFNFFALTRIFSSRTRFYVLARFYVFTRFDGHPLKFIIYTTTNNQNYQSEQK